MNPVRSTALASLSWWLPGIALWLALVAVADAFHPTASRWLVPGPTVVTLIGVPSLWAVGATVIHALSTWAVDQLEGVLGDPTVQALQGTGALSEAEHAEVIHGLLRAELLSEEERATLPTRPDVARLVYQRAAHTQVDPAQDAHRAAQRLRVRVHQAMAAVSALVTVLVGLGWLLWTVRVLGWLLLTILTLGYWGGQAPSPWQHPALAWGLTLSAPAATALLAWMADRARNHEVRETLLLAAWTPRGPGKGR